MSARIVTAGHHCNGAPYLLATQPCGYIVEVRQKQMVSTKICQDENTVSLVGLYCTCVMPSLIRDSQYSASHKPRRTAYIPSARATSTLSTEKTDFWNSCKSALGQHTVLPTNHVASSMNTKHVHYSDRSTIRARTVEKQLATTCGKRAKP